MLSWQEGYVIAPILMYNLNNSIPIVSELVII